MFKTVRNSLLVLLATMPLLAIAAPSAHEVVQQTTETLLADLKANKEQYRNNPNAFYDSLNEILGPVVDVEGIAEGERTSVGMEIRDGKGVVYPLSYTMVSMDGGWKLRNVVINGINVGKLFRDQFAQSMQNNRNDLDKVIDTWADTVARARQARGES
jgi:phospholipid transport system substrate-binding protein